VPDADHEKDDRPEEIAPRQRLALDEEGYDGRPVPGSTALLMTPESGRAPASAYRASSRSSTGTLPPIEYPGHFLVKRITSAGTFRFKHRLLFPSHALEPHPIGLEEVDDGVWSIRFCGVLLGRVDERDYIIRP
jgi:hypothetical protein